MLRLIACGNAASKLIMAIKIGFAAGEEEEEEEEEKRGRRRWANTGKS